MSLAADLGLTFSTRLHVDAAAALGILERRGVGKIRHLDVGALWLQEVQLRQKVAFMKVKGTSNPGDLMTKHLPQEQLNEYMNKLSFEFMEGRSRTTAQLHSALDKGHSAPRSPHTPASYAKTLKPGGKDECEGKHEDTSRYACQEPKENKNTASETEGPITPPIGHADSRRVTPTTAPLSTHVASSPGEATTSCGLGGNYKGSGGKVRSGKSQNLSVGIRITKGWRQESLNSWSGEFKGARAHRLPPGVSWREVRERETTDARSGEVIERIVVPENVFSEAAAGKKLDKVRDIRVLVKTEADVSKPSTSSACSGLPPSNRKRVMWGRYGL